MNISSKTGREFDLIFISRFNGSLRLRTRGLCGPGQCSYWSIVRLINALTRSILGNKNKHMNTI